MLEYYCNNKKVNETETTEKSSGNYNVTEPHTTLFLLAEGYFSQVIETKWLAHRALSIDTDNIFIYGYNLADRY